MDDASAIATARRMLERGKTSVATIALCTGLSRARIRALATETGTGAAPPIAPASAECGASQDLATEEPAAPSPPAPRPHDITPAGAAAAAVQTPPAPEPETAVGRSEGIATTPEEGTPVAAVKVRPASPTLRVKDEPWTPRELELVIDLIENRIADMAVVDREDVRDRNALDSALGKLKARRATLPARARSYARDKAAALETRAP